MAPIEQEPIPKDPTKQSPADTGRIAVEELIAFGSRTASSWSVEFKHDGASSSDAYGAFLDVLFDRFPNVVEKELETDDPHLQQRSIWLDNLELLENRYLDSNGSEEAVDYIAVGFSEPPVVDSTATPSASA